MYESGFPHRDEGAERAGGPAGGSGSASRDLVAKQPEATTEAAELVGCLLLHQAEAHGHERHAEDEIQRAGDHLLRAVRVEAGARHVVAEADGGQRDEAEVGGDERVPALGQREQERSEHDVADHEQQADADRHAHLHTARSTFFFRCKRNSRLAVQVKFILTLTLTQRWTSIGFTRGLG